MNSEGNAIQHLRGILKEHDIELVVEFYPWTRAKNVAEKEGYLGYFPAWPEEVEPAFVASNPIFYSRIAVMRLTATTLEYDSIKSLFRKYDVGTIRTYVYPEEIQKEINAKQAFSSSAINEFSLIKMLIANRHQAAITDPDVMMYMQEKIGESSIEVDRIVSSHPLVIAMHNRPENQKRIEKMMSIVNKLTNSH